MSWVETNETIFNREPDAPSLPPEAYTLNPSKRSKEDARLETERYQRLIKLGATEAQAKAGSWDVTAFSTMRIYLRAK